MADVEKEFVDPIGEEETEDTEPTKGSLHFGDTEFEVEDEYGEATWSEVCSVCCVHTPDEWLFILFGIFLVCFFLYWFLFGLDLLGNGAKVMSGCAAGELFGDDANPIAGLMIGILATVLLQSSSTTTSIIVSLVGDDNAISVEQGIYMVMGANIGTSVTNTIVAMGHMGDGDELERAFAGATVHDMFNFMAAAILLPLEVVTHYLKELTGAIIKNASVRDDEKWEGPVKKFVSPLAKRVIIVNKSVTKKIAQGDKTCDEFYPVNCTDGVDPSFDTCTSFGLIACDKNNNFCPVFFSESATAEDDKVSGGVVFVLSIAILFTCLIGLVAVLQKMLLGMSTRIIYKATDVNGYVAIALGAGITMVVQSSSITTSTLTPLVGMGALRLEQMFPLTLGANIGTTLTGITAALVSDNIQSLQVALAHLFFNVTGIVIFYPIPFMRKLPLFAARRLGRATRIWRGFPIVYIVVMFVCVPLILLAISALFEEESPGFTVLGIFIVLLIGSGLLYLLYWCLYLGGKEACTDCMILRERKRVAVATLADDMDFLKERVAALTEHTGLVVEDEYDEEEDDDDDEDYEIEN